MKNRPAMLTGKTVKIVTGCGNLFVTLNEDKGILTELSAKLGKSGGCASANLNSISDLINMLLEFDVDIETIASKLAGQRCHNPINTKGEWILSCADAIAIALKPYLTKKEAKQVDEEKAKVLEQEKK